MCLNFINFFLIKIETQKFNLMISKVKETSELEITVVSFL